MNSRPKKAEYSRNKNVLVIGGSGSGKTRFWLKPNLLQMHSSYVVTDPKGRRSDRVRKCTEEEWISNPDFRYGYVARSLCITIRFCIFTAKKIS